MLLQAFGLHLHQQDFSATSASSFTSYMCNDDHSSNLHTVQMRATVLGTTGLLVSGRMDIDLLLWYSAPEQVQHTAVLLPK